MLSRHKCVLKYRCSRKSTNIYNTFIISKWGIPRTGYLVPGRDDPELLPDWESCWDAAAAVVAVTWTCWKTTTFDNLGTWTDSYPYSHGCIYTYTTGICVCICMCIRICICMMPARGPQTLFLCCASARTPHSFTSRRQAQLHIKKLPNSGAEGAPGLWTHIRTYIRMMAWTRKAVSWQTTLISNGSDTFWFPQVKGLRHACCLRMLLPHPQSIALKSMYVMYACM